MDPTDMEDSKPPRKPLPPQRRPKSKVLRFLGINPYILKDFIPSGKTAAYLTLAASPVAFYLYDRRCAEQIMEQYKAKVRHLADAPMPNSGDVEKDELEFPRKVWIMSTRVPDDGENDRGNRWFKNYIQPILHAAGYDYSFLNGTAPGALGRRVAERIRLDRIANMTPQPRVTPGEAGYAEYLDKRRFAQAQGLTVIVARNTMKEYLWGLKHGWLTDFDAVQEERGEEGKMQDLREELAKDGTFDEVPRNLDIESLEGEEVSSFGTPAKPRSSLMPPVASFNFYHPPTPPIASTSNESLESKSLIIPAVSTVPTQPPMLFLSFDHPLGYFRRWPTKMFKFLFFERYRVQKGCETALAIIQAVHPQQNQAVTFMEDEEIRRGIRAIQPPKDTEQTSYKEEEPVQLENVLNEKKKKLLEEWDGFPLPVTGSKDLDTGLQEEYHYRKTFSETPANIVSQRKEFYDNLPEKLKTARELANRDRLPTKEEQKYPPPTEQELVEERVTKERRWANDFQGWLMTRAGSKVTWDPKFETFKVLDLDTAKASREKYGFVAETQDVQELS